MAGSMWQPTPYVFTTERGEPCDPRNALRALKAAATRAKLPSTVGLHTLRHSAASVMLSAGVPLKVVSEVSCDGTSVAGSVRSSVTVGWWLGGAALSVGAPLLPTQGSLARSWVDGRRPPLTREPRRRPWAGGWGQAWACPRCRAAPGDGFAARAAAGRGCGLGGGAAAGLGNSGSGLA